jgi:hypothetical protein
VGERPSVLAERPVAVIKMSERISERGFPLLACFTLIEIGRRGPPARPCGGSSTSSICASKIMRTLLVHKSRCSPRVMSRSTPMRFSAASSDFERTIIVTRQSSVEKIFAYSIAMMPARAVSTYCRVGRALVFCVTQRGWGGQTSADNGHTSWEKREIANGVRVEDTLIVVRDPRKPVRT